MPPAREPSHKLARTTTSSSSTVIVIENLRTSCQRPAATVGDGLVAVVLGVWAVELWWSPRWFAGHFVGPVE
jgi:hypothetical protein